MGATAEDDREYLQEPKRPRRAYAKYICIAASCIALVLLAVALSYPISNLLADKSLDGAYKSANVSDNEIDDTAPDGFRPTQDGYKRDGTRTGEQPPLSPPPPPLPPSSSTPATTTESTTTTTSTTQSTTTTTVTTETTTTTTEEASTERATKRHRRRSHREEPDTTTTVPLTNQTSRRYRWFNRTRSPIVPGYIVYEAAMKKVSVHIVYECHCPRSRRFIVSQLLPVYELLREYMHLRLLPFGRARVDNGTGGSDGGNRTASNTTTTPSSANSAEGSVDTESAEDSGATDSTDGGSSSSNSSAHNSTSSPTITCPRGSKECHSSMVQTCVLRHVEETLTAVRIIACMSRYPDPHRVGRRCVEKHGLEWHMVDQCVTEQGKLLMLDMGKKTWLITGSVNSVPLIRVGGESSHVIQVDAQTNLLELMCERLNNRPEACRGRQNATRDGLATNDTVSTGAPSVTTSQESSTAC